ncbi:hypothetical protein C6T71_23510 [Burkholderia multivorans]|nr:hypothetical protein C6T71_23510 [Burkholderia multivorans]
MSRAAAGRCGRADAALGLLADRVAEQTAIEQAADMGRAAAGRRGRADAALGLLADRVAEQTAIEQPTDMSRAAARMPRSAYLPIEPPNRPPPGSPPI